MRSSSSQTLMAVGAAQRQQQTGRVLLLHLLHATAVVVQVLQQAQLVKVAAAALLPPATCTWPTVQRPQLVEMVRLPPPQPHQVCQTLTIPGALPTTQTSASSAMTSFTR
jgi:hypothetical protein